MLFVDISLRRQELALRDGGPEGAVVWRAPVSSGKNGIGMEEGSFRTPVGLFEIGECIGGGLPANTIFRGRKPVGSWPDGIPEGLTPDADLILGRILRLRGLDPGNRNTWNRFIYIHGTNDTASLGTPASHGCIRLAPEDAVELFERCPPGTRVSVSAS